MTDIQGQEVKITVGEQLRHLREQKNFSVQDIASRLNLEGRIIEAIENNDFDKLSAATYARGYLRSYAKLLEVDPESILSAYNEGAPEPPEIIPEVKHTSQTSSSDKPVMAFTYLVTLSLVILLMAWWYSNFIVDGGSLSGAGVVKEEEKVIPGLSYEIPIVEHSSLPFYRAPDETMKETDGGIEADIPTDIDNSTIKTSEGEDESEYPLMVSSDNEGPDLLVLRITKDSWVEVYDSLENSVFVGLTQTGQVLSLRGTAPFKIVLGFAEGVSVEINGKTFDTAPYASGSIARFSLDR